MRVFKGIIAKIKIKQYQFFKMFETKKCTKKKIILLAIFALLALVFSLNASYKIEVAKLEKDLQKKHDNESSDILYYLSNDITKAMSSLKVQQFQIWSNYLLGLILTSEMYKKIRKYTCILQKS